jgi:hypothetical protein
MRILISGAAGLRKTVHGYLENTLWIQGILDGSSRLERLGVGR